MTEQERAEPQEEHALAFSRPGFYWRAVCSCGWMSPRGYMTKKQAELAAQKAHAKVTS